MPQAEPDAATHCCASRGLAAQIPFLCGGPWDGVLLSPAHGHHLSPELLECHSRSSVAPPQVMAVVDKGGTPVEPAEHGVQRDTARGAAPLVLVDSLHPRTGTGSRDWHGRAST